MTDATRPALAPTALLVGASEVRIWGMSAAERLRRQLKRVNVTDVREQAEAPATGETLLFRLDHAYEQRLVEALAERPGATLVSDGVAVAANVPGANAAAAAAALAEGRVPAGTEALDSEGLAGSYNRKLRKREIAYVAPLNARSAADFEARSFAGSYKGVTDVVTKYVWPLPARIVTKWCAERGITPNQVTMVSLLLVFVALWLFWNGHYGWGLVAAWIMTFLDTVDGKLARVTMTYSKFGDVLDHGIDLVHPPFWWWAWIVGLPAVGLPLERPGLAVGIIIGGYVVQRLLEGAFLRLFGMHMHVWRPFDSFFRLITARRNPNLVILTVFTLFGRPDLGMIVVLWWIVLSLVVHAAQVVQGVIASRKAPVTSWLSA
ncbi:CDP-alcohol phosphatidyltransferase family protein [Hansschlegelia sp.]|uniref:CDP-alcohol phosphatidyltransferase family protein n=1 Tax=Hansschlegelia sp. TaxID=2041892 RepID=UPI002CFBB755|nr:CDP-alcohol phosphatidyltransferase family protein [Hansschlegelia sp.]HVI30096.1 CDP-alcohol phosphatidyltransferase family protein [Hansschlegelia sp.]